MINWLLTNKFILQAGLAGLAISAIAGPLGSIMLWRRMAYFGDALAHSTLLGIVLATLLHMNVYLGLIGMCFLVSGVLLSAVNKASIANDTLLSILSSSLLSIGLIIATTIPDIRLDLLSYFYGDILAIAVPDLYWIFGVVAVALLILLKLWRWILLITLDQDLAVVDGIPVKKLQWLLVLLMAIVFAVTMRLLGMLLIAALFVIPVAAARRFARTPEAMAILGSFFSGVAVMVGLWFSTYYDWPTGPAIVVAAAGIFLLSCCKRCGS